MPAATADHEARCHVAPMQVNHAYRREAIPAFIVAVSTALHPQYADDSALGEKPLRDMMRAMGVRCLPRR